MCVWHDPHKGARHGRQSPLPPDPEHRLVGVRSIIKKTPNATIDERLLGITLGVQEAAAKAYVLELRSVGILSDENKATPLAQKWRLDESYADAVSQIIENVYPESLVHLAPPGEAERQKVVSGFCGRD